MFAKRVLVAATLVAASAMACLPAKSKSEVTFETINAKMEKFDDNDCHGVWHLFWENRNNNKINSYLILSALAFQGEHPWQPASDLENSEIAFRFAALAHRNGQILSLNALYKIESEYERESLILPLMIVEAYVQHLISNKESKYYDPSFEVCRKPSLDSDVDSGVDNFDICFGELLKKMDSSGISETSMSPPDTHIQCSEKKLLEGFY
ncbi:hypothetical protein [Mesorhizobium delmotii]|nr:hypothetical protein [Mesorhizobium delmotii]